MLRVCMDGRPNHPTLVLPWHADPPAVQCGASAYALGSNATERDAELVDLLLSSVGFCIRGAPRHAALHCAMLCLH